MNAFTKAWRHLRRTPYQSLAAVMVMFSSFFLISAMVFLMMGLASVLGYLETRPEVIGFISDKAKDTEVKQLILNLQNRTGVKEVRYVSKEEALKIYREAHKDNPLLLEMVTAAFLPASVEVSAESPVILQEIAGDMKNQTQVFEDVVFQQDVVDVLMRWSAAVRRLAVGLIGFLTVQAMVVVAVIVSMKITLRKKEIAILNLLGARTGYIINPFLIEGMTYGVFGAIMGWGGAYGVVAYLRPLVESFFKEIPFWPTDVTPFGLVLAAEVIFGLFIGLSASLLAVKRYARR